MESKDEEGLKTTDESNILRVETISCCRGPIRDNSDQKEMFTQDGDTDGILTEGDETEEMDVKGDGTV